MGALDFGAMIKKKRDHQGWTMVDVTQLLETQHGIVITRASVSLWENNKAIPRMPTLRALMEVYNMTPLERLLAYEVIGQ